MEIFFALILVLMFCVAATRHPQPRKITAMTIAARLARSSGRKI